MSRSPLAVASGTKPDPWSERALDAAGRYESMDNERLKAELERLATVTVEGIIAMAAIVRILDARGVDLSGLRLRWLSKIRRVAYGSLQPGFILLAIQARELAKAAELLPMPDQQRIVDDEPLPVIVLREGVGPEPRMVRPSLMESWQIRQVFARDHVRSETEQVNYLDNPRRRPIPKTPAPDQQLDVRNKRLIVSGERVVLTLDRLLEIVKELTRK